MNRALVLSMSMLACVGCAGARTTIVAHDARFPVSLSEGMRAPDGHLLEPGEMEVVGQFESKRTIWGLLYSIIPLTPTTDLSQEVDRQVEAAGGQAIVRLKTEAQHCALNHFIVFSFIPVWPGCSNLVVSGDIIRYRPTVAPASLPAPSPAAPAPATPPAAPRMIKRSKGRTRRRSAKRLVPLLGLFLLQACTGDCETERCSSGRTYQSCVVGKALVIRDDRGVEFSRCEPDYGPGNASGVYVGTDKNDCALEHSLARDAICERYANGGFGGGGGGGGAGGGPGGGAPTGTRHCYKSNDNAFCECSNKVEWSYETNSEYTKVSTCAASVGLVGPACCVARDANDKVTSCYCTSQPRACRENGGVCSCPLDNAAGNISQVRSSCEPTGGRICCISNSYCKCGMEQYSGAGCIGFGGLNEDATQVSSCTAPAVPIDWCHGEEKTNCDGLQWAP